jgi:hypothetical protein
MHDSHDVLAQLLDHDRGGFQALANRGDFAYLAAAPSCQKNTDVFSGPGLCPLDLINSIYKIYKNKAKNKSVDNYTLCNLFNMLIIILASEDDRYEAVGEN